MIDHREYLILSLKMSRKTPDYPGSEHLVWYRTASNGYTTDLMHAGRYTAREATQHEQEGVTVAVSLAKALVMARVMTVVPAEQAYVDAMISALPTTVDEVRLEEARQELNPVELPESLRDPMAILAREGAKHER